MIKFHKAAYIIHYLCFLSFANENVITQNLYGHK